LPTKIGKIVESWCETLGLKKFNKMLTKRILYVIFPMVIQGISYLKSSLKITRKGKLLERVGRKATGLNLEERYGS
jgi:hypothetical protein